ncbi:MAG: hypothetical protein ACPGUV_02910 [Polyangiales bacterium]
MHVPTAPPPAHRLLLVFLATLCACATLNACAKGGPDPDFEPDAGRGTGSALEADCDAEVALCLESDEAEALENDAAVLMVFWTPELSDTEDFDPEPEIEIGLERTVEFRDDVAFSGTEDVMRVALDDISAPSADGLFLCERDLNDCDDGRGDPSDCPCETGERAAFAFVYVLDKDEADNIDRSNPELPSDPRVWLQEARLAYAPRAVSSPDAPLDDIFSSSIEADVRIYRHSGDARGSDFELSVVSSERSFELE